MVTSRPLLWFLRVSAIWGGASRRAVASFLGRKLTGSTPSYSVQKLPLKFPTFTWPNAHRTNANGQQHSIDAGPSTIDKCSTQCRATLETLAEIKNPRPVVFVRQANIANGPQQVNNGSTRPWRRRRAIRLSGRPVVWPAWQQRNRRQERQQRSPPRKGRPFV